MVSNFILQALKSEPVTLYGNGNQTRSFCYVDDLIDGAVGLMSAPDEETGPINLGSPLEISIRELATKVIGLIGSKSKIETRPLPDDDPVQRCPDITLARKVLKWEPKVPLDEGLAKTISYFENLLKTGF